MDFILLIIWVVLGTILFGVLNKAVHITYFGFSAIFGTWIGCMAAIAIGFYFAASFFTYIVSLVISFVTAYYKWIIGIVAVLIIMAMLSSKSDTKQDRVEESVEQEK